MNDSTGGDGGRRGRRRSATGAREDSRNVSVRLGTRNRASSSRTEPASLESGRTPPLPRRTRRCGSRGCSARSSRAHGGDARETHLRFFGASGAARHQKGVALFRERHARGSGHRRSDATPARFGCLPSFFEWRLQIAPFLDPYEIQSHKSRSERCEFVLCKKRKTKKCVFFFLVFFLLSSLRSLPPSPSSSSITPHRPPSPSRRPFSSSRRARATWRARRAG